MALALVWFAHLAANGLYLARDGQETRLFDSTYHLEFVYQVVAGIEHGGLTGLRQELPSSVEWPPLTHLVLGLLASTVDAALPAVRLYNLLFLGLLLVGVYGCGRRLAHVAAYPARTARAVGLLAAALCSLLPAIYGGARQVGLDFPAAAMVALALSAVLTTDGFARRGPSLAAGLLLGLAILTRGQSLFFVAGVGLWQLLRRHPHRRRTRWLHAGLAAAIALAVSAPWWLGQWRSILAMLQVHADPARLPLEGDASLWGGVTLYLGRLYQLTGAPLGLLMLGGYVLAARNVRARRPLALLGLAWFAVPLVVHLLLAVRNLRYLLPLAPVLPLVASVGLLGLRRPRLRRIAVACTLIVAVGSWLACSLRRGPSCLAGCGGVELNRPLGVDPLRTQALALSRQVSRLARLTPHVGRDILLLLRHGRDRRVDYPLASVALYLRAWLPRVMVYHNRRPIPPWQRVAMDHAALRLVLLAPGTPRPADATRRIAAIRVPLGTAVGPAPPDSGTCRLELWPLRPGSRWRPPPEGAE